MAKSIALKKHGYYPAYWGIDENGAITSLVLDFFVLDLPSINN
ncbi:hypothetical protein [Flavobacterium sp. GNP001]